MVVVVVVVVVVGADVVVVAGAADIVIKHVLIRYDTSFSYKRGGRGGLGLTTYTYLCITYLDNCHRF